MIGLEPPEEGREAELPFPRLHSFLEWKIEEENITTKNVNEYGYI
ncbi:MAG: hypothetical protein ABH865_07875 [Candidatus Omnitrophota bacterium]